MFFRIICRSSSDKKTQWHFLNICSKLQNTFIRDELLYCCLIYLWIPELSHSWYIKYDKLFILIFLVYDLNEWNRFNVLFWNFLVTCAHILHTIVIYMYGTLKPPNGTHFPGDCRGIFLRFKLWGTQNHGLTFHPNHLCSIPLMSSLGKGIKVIGVNVMTPPYRNPTWGLYYLTEHII